MLKHLKLDRIRIRRSFNALDVALVFKLRSKGATHTAISEIIGCSRVYIGMILRGERRLGDTIKIDAQIEQVQDLVVTQRERLQVIRNRNDKNKPKSF